MLHLETFGSKEKPANIGASVWTSSETKVLITSGLPNE